jgi:hypothetical protein
MSDYNTSISVFYSDLFYLLQVGVQRGLVLHLITHVHTHTHTHRNSVGFPWVKDRPIVEYSTCTTHNTHNRQIAMHLAEFEPAIPTSKRTQTHALDRAANGIGAFLSFRMSLYTEEGNSSYFLGHTEILLSTGRRALQVCSGNAEIS